MACFSADKPKIQPLPGRIDFAEQEPEKKKKKKGFGQAQRPEDLGILSLSKGGRLGSGSLFG